MTAKKIASRPAKFAMAALVAAVMAPLVPGGSALAQSSDGTATMGVKDSLQHKGASPDQPMVGLGHQASVYDILGSTQEEVQSETGRVSASSESGPLADYQHEMESNNLDGAARALAAVSNRPITQALVNDLNASLGIETTLTPDQVAKAAADRQDPADMTMSLWEEDVANGSYAMLNTHTRSFDAYEKAMRSGNLDAAAEALNKATDRPITEDLVVRVNNDLGVESNLTAKQVAEAASAKRTAD